tara:strand:- start:860 stop:1117 length:258 start_codon:yes stop_codon:yes gene_type:complete
MRYDKIIRDIEEELQSWGGRVEFEGELVEDFGGGYSEVHYTLDISDSPLIPEKIERIAYELGADEVTIRSFGGVYEVTITIEKEY